MMEEFIKLILQAGVPILLAVVYAESGLLIGFLFPGDSLLFTAGAFARNGMPIPLDNIHLLVGLVALAAILGDSTGYAFGHKVGRNLFERKNARFFRKSHLIEAEKFYEKHGAKAIILARFVPVVRTFAPIVAGISKMHYRTFVLYNIIGGVAWSGIFIYLGYFVGEALNKAGVNIEITAIIIVLLSVSPMIWHVLKDGTRRQALWEGTKRKIAVLLNRRKKL